MEGYFLAKFAEGTRSLVVVHYFIVFWAKNVYTEILKSGML